MADLGYQSFEAENGREGLEVLTTKSDVIEVVLVDWNMPEMNGLEFVQAVRKSVHLARHKLVMVTTETEPARMAKALLAGVDEFVMKPFTREILVDKLRLIGVHPRIASNDSDVKSDCVNAG